MPVVYKIHAFIKPTLVLLAIFVCAIAPAQATDNKSVIIMLGDEGPGGCELLGQVKGSSKESEADTGDAPYTERLIRARKNLVTEAQKLGGNNVHVVHASNTGKYEFPGMDKEIVFTGDVYRCE